MWSAAFGLQQCKERPARFLLGDFLFSPQQSSAGALVRDESRAPYDAQHRHDAMHRHDACARMPIVEA